MRRRPKSTTVSSFKIHATRSIGNRDESLVATLESYDEGELQIPKFQRDFIWTDKKIKDWAITIVTGMPVGVVVTYQINGLGPEFLADGFQRLNATRRFIDNPGKYGFEFDSKQAKHYCKKFQVTIQHRHYANHLEAMQAFRDLNKGTPPTAREVHKGELTLSRIGEMIYDEIPIKVKMIEGIISQSTQARGRRTESKLYRDCLGLFFQYITEDTQINFYDVNNEQERPSQSVESKLNQFVSDARWDETSASRVMNEFERFIASSARMIEAAVEKTGQKEKPFSPGAIRWLFHLCVWRRNNKRPVELLEDFLLKWTEHYRPLKVFGTRFAYQVGDRIDFLSMQTSNLSQLKRICECLKSDLYIGKGNRKRRLARPGLDNSHIVPFMKFGEGDTLYEPSSINRARGAKTIAMMSESEYVEQGAR